MLWGSVATPQAYPARAVSARRICLQRGRMFCVRTHEHITALHRTVAIYTQTTNTHEHVLLGTSHYDYTPCTDGCRQRRPASAALRCRRWPGGRQAARARVRR